MTNFINFIAENWYMVVLAICAVIVLVSKIIEFIGYPTKKKMEEIKTRLLSYVTNAEVFLGQETGELKLAQAYDYFCDAYPYIKKWISMEKFKDLVDEVLPTMRKILEEEEGE